jgi:hypothetical protein
MTPCITCSGTGSVLFWSCTSCAGHGRVYRRLRVIEGGRDPKPETQAEALARAYSRQKALNARRNFRVIKPA